jgi:DNA-binding LacI/PurR family transcriptional regulator
MTGYEKALSTNGMVINLKERLFLDFPVFSSPGDILPGTFRNAITAFLMANPQLDGLISIGDNIGLDLYRTIQELRIQVPSRLQLIFFDDEYREYKDLLPFTPTVIAQQTYTIGYEAARALTTLLENPAAGITRKLVPSKLILGQSTEGGEKNH